MDLFCSLRMACLDEVNPIARHIIEGWAMCSKCRAFVLDRGLTYPDGKLVVYDPRKR
jgi:hypothetical protein